MKRENILPRKAWRKFTQGDRFRKLKLNLKQIIGTEPKFTTDINLITQSYPGWVIVPGIIHDNDIVFSVGICNDIGFELGIIEQHNLQIFAFDPTPYSVQWIKKQKLPPEFHFYPWAAAGKDDKLFLYPRITKHGKASELLYTFHKQDEHRNDGVVVEALTIESMANKLGLKKIDILKLDIEGAEYEVFDNLLSTSLRPKQILVEFHHRFKGIGKEKTIKAINSLHEKGYLIAHISVTGREICFVHQSAITLNLKKQGEL